MEAKSPMSSVGGVVGLRARNGLDVDSVIVELPLIDRPIGRNGERGGIGGEDGCSWEEEAFLCSFKLSVGVLIIPTRLPRGPLFRREFVVAAIVLLAVDIDERTWNILGAAVQHSPVLPQV